MKKYTAFVNGKEVRTFDSMPTVVELGQVREQHNANLSRTTTISRYQWFNRIDEIQYHFLTQERKA